MAERAITQDEGLGAAIPASAPLPTHFPGTRSIATDWKPIGQLLRDKSDVSSHPGTGRVCLLGLERPSNITQPFDLLTPSGPFFFPAVMDYFEVRIL